MRVLVDTNVLLRAADHAHPQNEMATQATAALARRGDTPCLVPQNFYEFWVVCTRPLGENGLGMATDLVLRHFSEFKLAFDLLDEMPAVVSTWEELVARYGVQGKSAHDTRLVAAMKVHGVAHLLTFNEQHFLRYEGITVLTPDMARTMS